MSSDDESVDLTKLIKESNEYYERRKILRKVVEEEEEERLKQPAFYRHRKWEGRSPYDMSCWARMLVNEGVMAGLPSESRENDCL